MEKDYKAFLVSVNVLDKKTEAIYMYREKLAVPIANGWIVVGKGEEQLPINSDNYEFVTYHTLNEIIYGIDTIYDLETKVEIKDNKVVCNKN